MDYFFTKLHYIICSLFVQIYDSTRKLRIACFTDIGKLSSAPACCRAVDLAKDALVKAGHEVTLHK